MTDYYEKIASEIISAIDADWSWGLTASAEKHIQEAKKEIIRILHRVLKKERSVCIEEMSNTTPPNVSNVDYFQGFTSGVDAALNIIKDRQHEIDDEIKIKHIKQERKFNSCVKRGF